MDKYDEVADGHYIIAKQKGQVQNKICNNNGDPFIATLYNVLLAPDLWDGLFLINTLMDLGHNCLFQKGFCTVYFGDKKKNTVTMPHTAQRKHAFLGEIKEMSKSKKIAPRNTVALELFLLIS